MQETLINLSFNPKEGKLKYLCNCSVSVTMDALPPLQEIGNFFSCCELCTENRRCHLVILVITFVLMTFDMITDWINWIEWYGIGGYDQYFFASVFETIFLCVAVVSTVLWIVEVIVIIKKWINIYRKRPQRKPTTNAQNFFKNYECMLESEVKNYLEDEEENSFKHSSSESDNRNYVKSLSKQESTKHTQPQIRKHVQNEVRNCEPEVSNHKGSAFELEMMNNIKSLFKPEITNNNGSAFVPQVTDNKEPPCEPELLTYKEFPSQPEARNITKFPFKPQVMNSKEFPSEPEVINNTEFPSRPEVINNKEFPSKPEVFNNKEFPSRPEVKNNKEFPSEPEVKNNKEFPPRPEVINNKKFPPELQIINNKEFPHEPEVMNHIECPSKPEFPPQSEVINYQKCTSRNGEEQEEQSGSNRTVNRLRIAVLILAGMLEDFPNVIVIYHTALMPLCGSATKQNIGSGVTIATVISSILNSLWTMFCLFFELCRCTKRDLKDKELNIQVEDAGSNSSEQIDKTQIQTSRECLLNPFKTCNTQALEIIGKVFICFVIFVTFTATFVFGFMTLSHVLGFIDLKFTYAGPLNLSTHVITGFYGPGLDAKPDEAMFIYLHYRLPDAHYITLSNSKQTKSTSFKQVINRLYIGQFQELSHLKDQTLTKAVPCSRDMPFLQSLDELADCKIIFTLRYFPINNNWQPFTNLIHDYHKFITIEYGINIKDNKTCPKWTNQTSYPSLLSTKVQKDILNYTCNSACGEDSGICGNVKSWNIDQIQGMNSSNESVMLWHRSLAVHGLKTPDTCDFHLTFQYSKKFCDGYWDDIELVKEPDEIKNAYPQFITVPITTTWNESCNLRIFNNSCDKLWQKETFLGLDHY